MPLYRYRAVSPAGEVSSGELDAANESEIVDRLRDQGLMPMQIAPPAARRGRDRRRARRSHARASLVRVEDA